MGCVSCFDLFDLFFVVFVLWYGEILWDEEIVGVVVFDVYDVVW